MTGDEIKEQIYDAVACDDMFYRPELRDAICEMVDENAKLRELARDALMLTEDTDCYGCRYDEHADCEHGYECMLLRRANELGIEVDE